MSIPWQRYVGEHARTADTVTAVVLFAVFLLGSEAHRVRYGPAGRGGPVRRPGSALLRGRFPAADPPPHGALGDPAPGGRRRHAGPSAPAVAVGTGHDRAVPAGRDDRPRALTHRPRAERRGRPSPGRANAEAGTAAHRARTHPEQARERLDARLTPRPGLGRLGRRTVAFESVGPTVHMITEGTPRPSAPEVDLRAHRLVQEPPPNLAEHARPSTAPPGRSPPSRRLRDHHPRPRPPPLPDAQKPVTHGTGTMRREERTP